MYVVSEHDICLTKGLLVRGGHEGVYKNVNDPTDMAEGGLEVGRNINYTTRVSRGALGILSAIKLNVR